MKRKVTFGIPEGRYPELLCLARERGFSSLAALARFALYQYANRYPVQVQQAGGENGVHVRPDASEGK